MYRSCSGSHAADPVSGRPDPSVAPPAQRPGARAERPIRISVDVLVDTEEGWIIIDHKSFRGGKNEWDQKAYGDSGQLEAYRRAVTQATERPVISQWIHFSVGGGMVEVMLNQA